MTAVLIDGFALSDASRRRGIGTYLTQVIDGLADEPDLQLTVYGAGPARLGDGVGRLDSRPHVPQRLRDVEHELRLPFAVRRARCDVLFSPAQHPPRHCRVPWVQTLHDLTPLTWPHPELAGEARRWRRVGARLRDASVVIAVSRFSADEGICRFHLDPRRLTVIPLGVDPAVFHPVPDALDDPPYLLHVAAWGPHKGFAEALAVTARLADDGFAHRLVLAGPNDAWMRAQIERTVATSPRPDRAEIAGYVPDLAATYRGAAALLMTSRCEGFGLPALEAMASGTPVVAFGNSAVREVVADGGVLVPDGDVTAMAKAVAQLLRDDAARAELVERGLRRAASFRWTETVASHAEVLRAVAS